MGTPVAACVCQRLGCAAAVLLARSPQHGNKTARAARVRGNWGLCDSPRLSSGRAGASSHSTLSKLLELGETLRLCSCAAARLSFARLARPHNVPRASLGCSRKQAARSGEVTPGIHSVAKNNVKLVGSFLLSPKGTLCYLPGTHPQHGECPAEPHPAAGARGAKPRPKVRLCAQLTTTSGQFSGRLILLVSAQSAFNQGSKSDGMASFPSDFGHAASGWSLTEPTGREKYLAALRGLPARPCRRRAPGSAAWELGVRGRRELGQEPSRGCLDPSALLGAALQGRIWQGSQRKAVASARAHSTLPLGGGGKPGLGEEDPAPRAHCRLAQAQGAGRRTYRRLGYPGCKRPRGQRDRVRASLSPDSAGKHSWLAPLCLVSPVLGPLPIPDTRRAQRSRKKPQSRVTLVALSLARLVREGGGCALRQVGRVLGANFGPPALRKPPLLRDENHKWDHQCILETPSSRTSRSCLSLTVLRSSRGGGGGSAPGVGSCWRGQPSLRRPPSGLARLQITPWLAAHARRRPLQLVAKFMPAALQWRPQSARSIPTTRLRAVSPEGGVSGV